MSCRKKNSTVKMKKKKKKPGIMEIDRSISLWPQIKLIEFNMLGYS